MEGKSKLAVRDLFAKGQSPPPEREKHRHVCFNACNDQIVARTEYCFTVEVRREYSQGKATLKQLSKQHCAELFHLRGRSEAHPKRVKEQLLRE